MINVVHAGKLFGGKIFDTNASYGWSHIALLSNSSLI